MNALVVRIGRLEPMRVASAYGFGVNPEQLAWQMLTGWAKPKGLLDDLDAHPIFGFNNPYPLPGNPKYGYEFWIKVGAEVEPEGQIRITEFLGGLYAVTRCEVQGHPETNVPAGWKNLAEWCKSNHHVFGSHHALERCLSDPEDQEHLVLNLYCPIVA